MLLSHDFMFKPYHLDFKHSFFVILLCLFFGRGCLSTHMAGIELAKGVNGLEKIILRESRGSSAEVYLYGGHVTSWKNEQGEELLFVSSKAWFNPPKPIRGGIPICFPQFSNLGPLESHGFVRNKFWSIDTDPPAFPTNSTSKAYIDLILKASEEDMKIWPHSYEFRLRVALGPGGDLMLTSRIRNTNSDGKPFTFTFAYHTYFSVSDISEVRVEGLETLDYLDNLQNRKRFTEQGDAITFEGEVDKIYLSTPTKIAILDHEKKRTLVLRKDGLPDAVVWNPWDKRAKTIPDLGDDEYKYMLCVEAAAIEKPITLKPGEEWRVRQELSTVPSSYCSGQLDPQKVVLGN
ncbi:putative glucose-6-phosphate 1-epimerase [Hibiscus syriacus]|uniref:glucose-6-phosphate 1-epimerase n=1 Tax=Hibiscus syriacus TaxID=106335 RepID=A0A6A2ZYL0_HIBSY|nr:putative glucose-6-phosphate 1-epimerase [Hibiscus syriacus]XP_039008530.1 putative glucose-6-phosphate 1-epimerase [Hibiscus syriacus]XP_039008531.1 putative glucose-6-phosphate 1-epimerase [Hibiscus syriacus]KAE8697080.1 putative glucose-6-phosphate 1-epimerase [Hibiscus syriacus]